MNNKQTLGYSIATLFASVWGGAYFCGNGPEWTHFPSFMTAYLMGIASVIGIVFSAYRMEEGDE